jgi:hypothetical protein
MLGIVANGCYRHYLQHGCTDHQSVHHVRMCTLRLRLLTGLPHVLLALTAGEAGKRATAHTMHKETEYLGSLQLNSQ